MTAPHSADSVFHVPLSITAGLAVGKRLPFGRLLGETGLSTTSPTLSPQGPDPTAALTTGCSRLSGWSVNIMHKAYYNGYPVLRKTSSNRRDPASRASVKAYQYEE
jgi:hypothetical protein